MKTRTQEWNEFEVKVYDHIKEYAIEQYGDKGTDLITEKDAKYCIDQIHKYCHRFDKQQRPGEEILDLMKIAHYACMAYFKLCEAKEE